MQQHPFKTLIASSPQFLLILLFRQQSISLSSNSFHLALTGSLGLGTLGIHLVLDSLLTCLLSLGTVNLFIKKKGGTVSDLVFKQLQRKIMCARGCVGLFGLIRGAACSTRRPCSFSFLCF